MTDPPERVKRTEAHSSSARLQSCEANKINPTEYLKDVLVQIHDHPNSRINELLPHNWTGPRAELNHSNVT